MYQFPHTAATQTKRVYKVQYGGEVIVSDRWRAEFGEEVKNADQHFRVIYLTAKPEVDDGKITLELKDARTVVCRPESLSEETREALAAAAPYLLEPVAKVTVDTPGGSGSKAGSVLSSRRGQSAEQHARIRIGSDAIAAQHQRV